MKTLLEFDSPQIYCDMDGVLADFENGVVVLNVHEDDYMRKSLGVVLWSSQTRKIP